MITIIVYGLDQFVVGDLSRDMTPSLAKLYEVDENEIVFIATQNMVFYSGTEQTAWNVLIHVHAPLKVSVLQDQVASFLLESIGNVGIHKVVEFYYYSQDNRFEKIDETYPRYMADDNIVDIDAEYNEDIEEGEEDDQIFTGDIFEGIKK